MHDVIIENGGGEIFVSVNTWLCVNVALISTKEGIQKNVHLSDLSNYHCYSKEGEC